MYVDSMACSTPVCGVPNETAGILCCSTEQYGIDHNETDLEPLCDTWSKTWCCYITDVAAVRTLHTSCLGIRWLPPTSQLVRL